MENSDFTNRLDEIVKNFNPQQDLLSDSFKVIKKGSLEYRFVKILKFIGFGTDCDPTNMLNNLSTQFDLLNKRLQQSPFENYRLIVKKEAPESEQLIILNQKINTLSARVFRNQAGELQNLRNITPSIQEAARLLKKAEEVHDSDMKRERNVPLDIAIKKGKRGF